MPNTDSPTHGFTKHGHAIHGHTWDHHPNGSAYQRFNKKVAVLIANNVGTMTCCYLFLLIALCSLPATLVLAHVVSGSTFAIGGLYVASAGLVLLVTWVAQSFLQLVLLPALMVGQNIQNAANDIRATKQFEDTEAVKDAMITALDRLNTQTEGGITEILDAIVSPVIRAKILSQRGSRDTELKATSQDSLSGATQESTSK